MRDLVTINAAKILQAQVRVHLGLDKFKLQVHFEDEATTASAHLAYHQVEVTLPRKYCGRRVDGKLALGLCTHELGHGFWTDLEHLGEEQKKVQAQDPKLAGFVQQMANLLEDLRIDHQFNQQEPFRSYQLQERSAVRATPDFFPKSKRGLNPFQVMQFLIFGHETEVPDVPEGLPQKWGHLVDQALQYMRLGAVVVPMSKLYALARHLIVHYQDTLPDVPPELPRGASSGEGKGEGEGPKMTLTKRGGGAKALEGGHGLYPGRSSHSPKVVNCDRASLEAGRKLAQRIKKGWQSRPAGKVLVGVGRYQPRRDLPGYPIPPFEMELTKKPELPRNMVIALDVSASMSGRWSTDSGGLLAVERARRACVALAGAVEAQGGRVVRWVFASNAHQVSNDVELCSWDDGGTSVQFLSEVARRWPGKQWAKVIVTDAQISSIPAAWDKERENAVVLLISDSGDARSAKALAERVFVVGTKVAQLPAILASVTRKYFAQNQL